MRFVSRNEKHLIGRDSRSDPIDFSPAFPFGAKDQNTFIESIRALNDMTLRLGIPSEALDMQTDTKRMARHMAEPIGGRVMDDLAREPLCLCFHEL
jgi:hypothetical protein